MRSQSQTSGSLKIFFSYSHADEKLRDELAKHLSSLKRQGVIDEWHDRRIGAGREWKEEINTQLEEADIILLLVSPDFIASDYCYGVEVKRAMERHDSGEARVIPVILRSVIWERAPFSKLQALPKDAKPVTKWQDQDEAFESIARGVQREVEELKNEALLIEFRGACNKDDFDAAIELGRSILASDANHVIRKEVARVYSRRGDGLWWKAKGGWKRELTFPPAVLTRSQYEQILSDYNHSIELCPADPDYYFRRGELHAERSTLIGLKRFDYDRALSDYTRAIELDAGNGRYFYARATLIRPDIALAHKLLPDDVQERHAKLLHPDISVEDYEQSERDFQRAIELGYIDEKTGLPRIKQS